MSTAVALRALRLWFRCARDTRFLLQTSLAKLPASSHLTPPLLDAPDTANRFVFQIFPGKNSIALSVSTASRDPQKKQPLRVLYVRASTTRWMMDARKTRVALALATGPFGRALNGGFRVRPYHERSTMRDDEFALGAALDSGAAVWLCGMHESHFRAAAGLCERGNSCAHVPNFVCLRSRHSSCFKMSCAD